MPSDPTSRFSDRVDNYVKYRPDYPDAVIDFLRDVFHLSPGHVIADIGSGTGISSALFLKHGNRVIGIEPNDAMREQSVKLLAEFPKFDAQPGTAEHTGLATASVDFIIAGQAFHWFKRDETKIEFQRILKPQGVVVLIWNERLVDSDFAKAYDQLIVDHGIDYVKVDHRNIDDKAITAFYAPNTVAQKVMDHHQTLDFQGLKGRLTSSSYVPNENDVRYPAMIAALRVLFDRFEKEGVINIRYATRIYAGEFSDRR